MGRIILFFLGSALFLSGCKNSKQPEGYNSVNIIEYVNIYDENNRILTAQGSEYDYLYFGDNKDKGILAAIKTHRIVNNKRISYLVHEECCKFINPNEWRLLENIKSLDPLLYS